MKKTTISNSAVITDRSEELSMYFNEIRKFQPLSATDEFNLATLSMQGDAAARETLVNHNLLFVVSVAKTYTTKLELLDLINEGNMGLVEAVNTFDPNRGYRLITYAVFLIKAKINAFIEDSEKMVRLPKNQLSDLSKLRNARNDFYNSNMREPSLSELADLCDFSESKVADLMGIDAREVSFDTPIGDESEGNEMTLLNITPSGDRADKFADAESTDCKMREILRVLTEQERDIVVKTFGLFGEEERCLELLATELGYSPQRVGQILNKAIAKLKDRKDFIKKIMRR